jgi:hypothetical protein
VLVSTSCALTSFVNCCCFAGIVEQIHTEEDGYTCIEHYCKQKHASLAHGCPHIDQIKIIQFTHNDARGPNFARYMQDTLRQHEDFCLQIDAHADFAPQWDTLLTEMWGSVQNEYAVLSSVPVDVAVLKQADLNGEHQMVPHLCQAKIDERYSMSSFRCFQHSTCITSSRVLMRGCC